MPTKMSSAATPRDDAAMARVVRGTARMRFTATTSEHPVLTAPTRSPTARDTAQRRLADEALSAFTAEATRHSAAAKSLAGKAVRDTSFADVEQCDKADQLLREYKALAKGLQLREKEAATAELEAMEQRVTAITEPYLARMSSLKTRKRAADASDLDALSSDEDTPLDAPAPVARPRVSSILKTKTKKPAPPAPPARTAGAGRGRR